MGLGDGFVIVGLPLRLDVSHDLVDFRLVDIGAVYTEQTRRAWRQEKHIAATEQVFRAVCVENRARIDLGRDAIRDPGRELGLNPSSIYIYRSTLTRHA